MNAKLEKLWKDVCFWTPRINDMPLAEHYAWMAAYQIDEFFIQEDKRKLKTLTQKIQNMRVQLSQSENELVELLCSDESHRFPAKAVHEAQAVIRAKRN